MSKKLKLKDDIMFKAFFSKKENKRFLESLLSAILDEKVKVKKVIHDARLEQLSEEEKYGVLDLNIEKSDGTKINVEMQIRDLKNIEKRTSFYGAKLLSEQLSSNMDYKELKDVIVIAILNYKFLPVKEYCNKTIRVLENHRDVAVNNSFKVIYIELEKFRNSNPDMKNVLNQWLALLDGENKGLIEMAKKENDIIEEADCEYEVLTGDAELKRLEDIRIKSQIEANTAHRFYFEEGEKAGLAKGEKSAKLEDAKKMLEENIPIPIISKVTGLTIEEIKQLKY